MAIGVTGREVKAAYARTNTWGTPASVTTGLLISSTEGLDNQCELVDDDAFNQDFLSTAEVGDTTPIQQEIGMQLRFENIDTWLASACGSAANPTVVSSTAANSQVAYSHAITLGRALETMYTLAVDMKRYVLEVPSFKIRGFTIRVGENGRMLIAFPISGAKTNYASTTNINSTVGGARAATLGNRAFRKNTRYRWNLQSAGALGASDEVGILREMTFTYARPMADQDHVFNQDYIIEPEDDGFGEMGLELTFARMSTAAANSLAIAYPSGTIFKADMLFQGPFINSTTRRSMLVEMPAVQIYTYRSVVTGHNQVRPVGMARMKQAETAPTGMAGLTLPFRITLINANSANLLA